MRATILGLIFTVLTVFMAGAALIALTEAQALAASAATLLCQLAAIGCFLRGARSASEID